jgi:hypothetical protein
MDFGWALRAMKNGEEVRRERWAPETRPNGAEPTLYKFVYLEYRDGHEPELMHQRHNGQRGHFHLLSDHLLAEDWELADDSDEALRTAAQRAREIIVRR